MRTIAIVNQKGGCGKTTTAINLAAVLARRGLRTLLVDMDPQSHCAAGLGVPESRIEYSVGDALMAEPPAHADFASLIWEVARDLHLIPSTTRLAGLEAPNSNLQRLPDRDRRLAALLERLADRYDRCLIDCAPSISLLTFNALRAAREALIPVETGFFALRGAEKQWVTIQRTIERIGRPIACHLLPTLFKPDSRLAKEILAALKRKFAGQILPIVIQDHDELREAASMGQPVIEFAPESMAVTDFNELADWLDEHALRTSVEIEVFPQRMPRPVELSPSVGPASSALRNGSGEDDGGDPNGAPVPSISAAALAAADSSGGTAVATPGQPGRSGGRAAELAARVRVRDRGHRLVSQCQSIAAPATVTVVAPLPEPAPCTAIVQVFAADSPAPYESPALPGSSIIVDSSSLATNPLPLIAPVSEPVFGVQPAPGGVQFSQPRDAGEHLAVAGDFNGWSATATPLRLNESLGIREAFVAIPPGQYRYRLVIDGRWQDDRYNPQRAPNDYGEENNVLVVP